MSNSRNQTAAKEKVAASSVLASFGMTAAKLVVGLMTGSMGILSEAAHSLLDLAAAVMTFFAVRYGDRPADDCHHYGHGKIESVSALAETGLLFVTSAWIIYEAVSRLLSGDLEVEVTWYAFAVIIGSIAIDVSRSRALAKVARETNSQALEADALHFSSDIWSSAAVLIGLVFVLLGVRGADAVAAIAVACFVAVAGWRLGKRTIDVLVDTAPTGVSDQVREIAARAHGVLGVERVRVRPLGGGLSIELGIRVGRQMPLGRVQEIVRHVEAELEHRLPGSEVLVHSRSVQLDTETVSEAVQALAHKEGVAVHDVLVDSLDGRQYVSYDVEVEDTLTVKEAHDAAMAFEDVVKRELGDTVEINSHIEPRKREAMLSSNVTDDETRAVLEVLNVADRAVQEISDIHNVLVRKIGQNYFVSLHCRAPGGMALEIMHNAASRLEYLMKDRMPNIKRVVIHVEPR
jgi:cation diffusion facilitator family transporter